MAASTTARAAVRAGAGLSLELPANDHIVGPWLRRTIPPHERLEAGTTWLIGDAFATAALEATRAAYPDLELNAPPRADDGPPVTAQPGILSYDDERRRIIERLPLRERSTFANQFHFGVRAGVRDPAALSHRAARAYLGREQQHKRYRDGVRAEQARRVLDVLIAHPDEAEAFAAWVIDYESLPAEARERLKSERGGEHRRRWMDCQEPTVKQLAYLRVLGFAGQVASRQHASELIESLKGARAS